MEETSEIPKKRHKKANKNKKDKPKVQVKKAVKEDKSNKCYTCKEPGHTARHCSKNAERQTKVIYVGNICYPTSEESIKEFFGQAATVADVEIPVGKNGHNKHHCFVEFETYAGPLKALDMLGEQKLDGKKVRLDLSFHNLHQN